MGGLTVAVALLAGCNRDPGVPAVRPELTADQVLHRLIRLYDDATAYQDNAVVRLQYRRGGKSYEDEARASVHWQAPNRIRVEAYQVEAVCDGKQLSARIKDEPTNNFDGQVVVRDAPPKLTLSELWEEDEILSLAFRQGLAGYPLQLDLLLSDTPLVALLDEGVERTLLESAKLDGHTCHRLRVDTADGTFVLWVDQQQGVLRRVEYPAATFAAEIAEDKAVEDLQLTVEFRAAELGTVPPEETFALRVPADAKRVKRFIPPPRELPSDLFGKTTTPYVFTDLSGESVTNQMLADRIKVFVWFNNHPACQATIQQLSQVYQQYKLQDRVAIRAVCAEPSSFTSQQVQALTASWQIDLPIVRDLQALGRDLFQIPWAPTLIVLDGNNVVQIFEVGANPNLVAELPQVLEQLLAGEDLAGTILDQFRREQTQYERALARGEPDVPVNLTEGTSVASVSGPQLLQLRPLWENVQLQATGNVVALEDNQQGLRFLVHEGWRTITEVGGQGNLITRHELDLPPLAAVSQLLSAVDSKGERYFVAWSLRSPQAHVFDAQWRRVLSYPPSSLQHDGVQDALLTDLDGDGNLELEVGFWGAAGVHSVSLSGTTLWTSGEISHVLSMLATPPVDGRRTLWVASASGAVTRCDQHGRGSQVGHNSGMLIHHLFGGSDQADVPIPYCGISYGLEGRRLALGLTPEPKSQWRYNLPGGAFDTQIRFVASARLLDRPRSPLVDRRRRRKRAYHQSGRPVYRFLPDR